MPQPKQKSLGRRLLQVVFGLYFFVALSVTLIQMYSEYRNVVTTLQSDIKQVHTTSQSAIGTALWDFNHEQVRRTITGLLDFNAVLGVIVLDNEGNLIAAVGSTPASSARTQPESSNAPATVSINLLEYPYQLRGIPIGESEERLMGSIRFYSSQDIVFSKVRYSLLLILINSIIKTLSLWVIFLIATNKLVQAPLREIQEVASSFNPDNPVRSGNLPALERICLRQDELGFLGRHFSGMIDAIANYVEKIKDFTHNLERLVAQRTHLLEEKNQNIEVIMETIELGVMAIDGECRVRPQHSARLCQILEEPQLVGKSISEVFLDGTDLSPDDKEKVISVIRSTMDGPSLSFEMNRKTFPTEATFKRGGKIKQFSLDWQALIVEDVISSYLLVIKDVSQERLEAYRRKLDGEDAQRTEQLLALGSRKYLSFYESSMDSYCQVKEMVLNAGNKGLDPDELSQLLMVLHTIKGNARIYHLETVVASCHDAETFFAALKKTPDTWSSVMAYEAIEDIQLALNSYHLMYNNRLVAFFGENQSQDLLNRINKAATGANESSDDKLSNILQLLRYGSISTLSDIATDVLQGLRETCKRHEKNLPTIQVNGGFTVRSAYSAALRSALVHSLSNCVVHGIETIADRAEAGKPDVPTIDISIRKEDGTILMHLKDDGRGLPIEKLMAKTGDQTTSTKIDFHQIAESVFQDGLSTAKDLSIDAGRGVGMGAVRQTIQDLGGSVHISFHHDHSSTIIPDYVPFTLVFHIPEDCLTDIGIEGQEIPITLSAAS